MGVFAKFLQYPQLAKLAAKSADESVQRRRTILGCFREARAIVKAKPQLTHNATLSKKDYVRYIFPASNSHLPSRRAADQTLQDLKQGGAGLRRELGNRNRAGKALGIASKSRASNINRVVNARGKGIVFRRIGGRLVPIRSK